MEIENTPVATELSPELKATVKSKSSGPLSRAQAYGLMLADTVGAAAQHEAYAMALAGRDITSEHTRKFLKLIEAAREGATVVVVSTTLRRVAVSNEAAARKNLAAMVREIQKAAKQKYARTNRLLLEDYLISKKWNTDTASLAQASQTVLDRASQDTLPGINVRLKEFHKVREEWVAASVAVAEAKTALANGRTELAKTLQAVDDQRFAIQTAADTEWPHTDESNRTTRIAFGLNPTRAMKGM